jgi:hypothetical protein
VSTHGHTTNLRSASTAVCTDSMLCSKKIRQKPFLLFFTDDAKFVQTPNVAIMKLHAILRLLTTFVGISSATLSNYRETHSSLDTRQSDLTRDIHYFDQPVRAPFSKPPSMSLIMLDRSIPFQSPLPTSRKWHVQTPLLR